MKTDVYLTILLSVLLPICGIHIPVEVTYTQQFAGKTITITERMTVAQRVALQDKEGFLCYGAP